VFDLPIEFTGHGSCFVLKAEGDSMEEVGIYESDYLVIREQPAAEDGDIVVAIREGCFSDENGQSTLKRLVKRNGKYYLHTECADERKYPDMDAGKFRIVGELIGFYRRLHK
jgi:repressor LexA